MKHRHASFLFFCIIGLSSLLKEILLHAADEEEGRQILRDIMVDRFVEGDYNNYATIRSMNSWLARQGVHP